MLRLAQHEPRAAAADFLLAGELLAAACVIGPGILPWRAAAARALALDGEAEEARSIAEEDLALARRFGNPRSIGVALAALSGGQTAARAGRLLQEAISALERSEDRLEHARALYLLGRSMRHNREPVAARAPLRQALELTVGLGARALEADVRSELLAAGARPRRSSLHGRDALTPAEQRVAGLAAEGLSNREIAQALFVTTSTVESQLRQAFRKLRIASRDQLPLALDARYEDVA